MREDTCSTPTYVVSFSSCTSWLGSWDGRSCVLLAFLRPPFLRSLLVFSGLPAFLSLPVGRTDPAGLASLAVAARGCRFPLLESLFPALLSAIFLCGLIAWSIQQPAVSTWLQGAIVLVADQENFEQLEGFTRKHLRKTKNLLKLKKREE